MVPLPICIHILSRRIAAVQHISSSCP